MSHLVALAAVIFLAPGGATRTQVEWSKDSFKTIQQNLDAKKAVLVDVRSPEEWKAGHVEGAVFLPVQSLFKHSFDAKKVAKTLPPKQGKGKKIIYTYCAVGMRSKQAAAILTPLGYEVRALKAGYEDLVEAGFSDAKPKRERETAAGGN